MSNAALAEQLLKDLSDVVVTSDLDGVITGANAALERLTGFARNDVVGQPYSMLIAPEHVDLVATLVRERRKTGPRAVYEIDVLTSEGGRIPVEISSMVLYDDGVPTGTLVIARDMRERRSIESQLREAQKMEAVGRLARVVAHDFNNVLLVMRGYGELMCMRLPEGDPTRVQAQKIVDEAERAVELTRRLLSFSRGSTLTVTEVDLAAELAGMRDSLDALLGAGVALDLRAGGPCLASADPTALQQICLNLAANARDAMPDGGEVTIECLPVSLDEIAAEQLPMLEPGRYALLRFSDTGSGMDEATRERAFEPMFTTKATGDGSGLGLAIVYRLVQQLGGSVTLLSEVGKGTTFSLYFPAV